MRPEPWALAAAVAFLGYQAPFLRRVAAGVVAGLIAPLLWTAWDWIVAGDPLLAVNRTDDLAEIARKLTPLRQAPKTMGKMIIGIDESTLFWVAAAGMAVVLVVALWRRRLPADPLPFLIVTVIPFVLLAEIARDYPLRQRYLLPLAIVIAIEAAVVLTLAGRAINRRFPGLRPYVACGFVIAAGYGVMFTVSRAPQVHTPVLPFVNGGVQILDTYKLDCRRIGFLAGRVRDVKVVPPLALHADEPLERFKFITPGDPVPTDLDVLVVPREQQIVPDPRFRPSRRSTSGCCTGPARAARRGFRCSERRSRRDVRRVVRGGPGRRAADAGGDDARDGDAGRRAVGAHRADEGSRRGRVRVVHGPPQPQGRRAGREPAGRARLPVGAARPSGARRGLGRADRRRGVLGVLPRRGRAARRSARGRRTSRP